jgi:hypothetical protein
MRVGAMKWILALYPLAWRQRYQEEMLALLEQHQITWRTVVDLLLGAVVARLDPYFKAASASATTVKTLRLRRAHGTILLAFPLLVLCHLLVLDGLDDVFDTWNRGHASLWRFKAVSGAITAIGFIALFVTGLWLALILAKQAAQEHGKRLVLPLGGLVVAMTLYGIHAYVPWVMSRLFPLFIAASPLPLAYAVSRCEIQPRLLCYALAPAALAVLGMAAQVIYVAVWGFAIWRVSPEAVQRMAEEANRSLLPGLWHVQLLGGLLWMALMTGTAAWRFGQVLMGFRQDRIPKAEAS